MAAWAPGKADPAGVPSWVWVWAVVAARVAARVVARVSEAASPRQDAGFQDPAAPLPDLGILSSLKADSRFPVVNSKGLSSP